MTSLLSRDQSNEKISSALKLVSLFGSLVLLRIDSNSKIGNHTVTAVAQVVSESTFSAYSAVLCVSAFHMVLRFFTAEAQRTAEIRRERECVCVRSEEHTSELQSQSK